MNIERPRIKVPLQHIDIVIDLASIALLLIMWGLFIRVYGDLPEEVPTHFSASGQVDGYGSKASLWFLPGLATFIYIGIFLLNRYPHLHNYMVNITEENAFKQYQFSTRMLRIVNFLCVLMFAYILYRLIATIEGNAIGLGDLFLYIVLGLSLAIPIVFIILQKRITK